MSCSNGKSTLNVGVLCLKAHVDKIIQVEKVKVMSERKRARSYKKVMDLTVNQLLHITI